MKRKLPPAKTPIPKFRADNEAAEYFETHSLAGVWDQLAEAKPARLTKSAEKTLRERRAAAKTPISIRLAPDQIAAARKIAAAKSVGYQTQLRMWIVEGIRRDAKRA